MRSFRNRKNKDHVFSEEEARSILNNPVPEDMAVNLQTLYQLFNLMPDLVTRPFQMKTGHNAVLVYLDGLVDKTSINAHILYPLIHEVKSLDDILRTGVTVGKVETACLWSEIERLLFQGVSILYMEGKSHAIVFHTQGWPQRSIQDPQMETSLKGAHQGFVETSSQSIALIRRFIPNRELKIKELMVGKRGTCKISILYLADVANPEVLEELEGRIRQLDVDSILNTGQLAEFIEDHPYSPFPQFPTTERPDTAASHLLQGRLVVVVDRSSSVLIAPGSFVAFFQSFDDYSTRWMTASLLRLLRFFGFFVGIFLPAIYIAVISFNHELIPLKLLLNIGEFREGVPFPPFLEALIMEVTLEMIREAGVRLPAPIGQTVGIVGAIVIGQAAVQAGIVSNMMIIIVASTAIASFIMPNYDMSEPIRLLRFLMMLVASIFGIVGIVIGLMTLIGHLISMESLGTPYGSPLAPVRFGDWKDMLVRLPLWKLDKRPHSVRAVQLKNQGHNRPKGGDGQ